MVSKYNYTLIKKWLDSLQYQALAKTKIMTVF